MSDFVTITSPGVEPPDGLPDISDWEFRTGDRTTRRDAWKVLGDTPGLPVHGTGDVSRRVAPGRARCHVGRRLARRAW